MEHYSSKINATCCVSYPQIIHKNGSTEGWRKEAVINTERSGKSVHTPAIITTAAPMWPKTHHWVRVWATIMLRSMSQGWSSSRLARIKPVRLAPEDRECPVRSPWAHLCLLTVSGFYPSALTCSALCTQTPSADTVFLVSQLCFFFLQWRVLCYVKSQDSALLLCCVS